GLIWNPRRKRAERDRGDQQPTPLAHSRGRRGFAERGRIRGCRAVLCSLHVQGLGCVQPGGKNLRGCLRIKTDGGNRLNEADIAAIAVTLACCLLVLRFTTSRWRHRFRAIGSRLIEPPAYRVLFLLVALGALLISTLPEAALVLPALDAIGLDLVTVLVAL